MPSPSAWLQTNLVENGVLVPDRLGVKRLIFEESQSGSFASSLISNASRGMRPTSRIKSSNELFLALHQCLAGKDATWLFLTDADGAVLLIRAEFSAGDLRLSGEERLWDFELLHPDQGCGQYLVLLLADNSAAVVFSRADSFEIAYYGPDDLWEEISSALGVASIEGS